MTQINPTTMWTVIIGLAIGSFALRCRTGTQLKLSTRSE